MLTVTMKMEPAPSKSYLLEALRVAGCELRTEIWERFRSETRLVVGLLRLELFGRQILIGLHLASGRNRNRRRRRARSWIRRRCRWSRRWRWTKETGTEKEKRLWAKRPIEARPLLRNTRSRWSSLSLCLFGYAEFEMGTRRLERGE